MLLGRIGQSLDGEQTAPSFASTHCIFSAWDIGECPAGINLHGDKMS